MSEYDIADLFFHFFSQNVITKYLDIYRFTFLTVIKFNRALSHLLQEILFTMDFFRLTQSFTVSRQRVIRVIIGARVYSTAPGGLLEQTKANPAFIED